MTFNIAWDLDESEGLNAESLLGKISMSDGTHAMVEDSVYVDSWIEALTEASRVATQGSTAFDIEIVEESRPLRVQRDQTGGLHVRFAGGEVVAESVEAFTSAVQCAAAAFIKGTTSIEGSNQNEALKKIRRFVVGDGDSLNCVRL